MRARRALILTALAAVAAVAVVVLVHRGDEPGPFRYLPHGEPDLAAQPAWGALHVVLTGAPREIHPGSTIHFQVQLENHAESPLRLDPCPLYVMGVEFEYPRDAHEHLITSGPRYFQFDCDAVPDSITGHGELTVPMRLRIPPLAEFRCTPNSDGGDPTCLPRGSDDGVIDWLLVSRHALTYHYGSVPVRLGD